MVDIAGGTEEEKSGIENRTNDDISTPVSSVIVNGYCSGFAGMSLQPGSFRFWTYSYSACQHNKLIVLLPQRVGV